MSFTARPFLHVVVRLLKTQPPLVLGQIQEVEDRRKIDVLLSLSGTTESSLTYFIKELDEGKLVRQHLPPQLQAFAKELDVKRRLEGRPSRDPFNECD